MKLVFVSGPYRGQAMIDIHKNIMNARTLSIKLWQRGYAVICPHMNTAHFDGLCHDDVWLNGDLEILRRCDAIAMVDGWQDSEGAVEEYKLAVELGKEIVDTSLLFNPF